MEVVAVLLPVLVAAGAVVLLVASLRYRPLLFAVCSWVVFAGVAVFTPWLPHGTGHPVPETSVRIAVANVAGGGRTPEDAAKDIIAVGADIVVVPEDTRAIDRYLRAAYPFARKVPRYTAAVGVYARVPVTELPPVADTFDPDRYARIRVETDEPFVLWALHLPRPWFTPRGSYQMRPGGHARTLDAVIDAMEDEDLPVVVAGDLNLTDRGRGFRKLTAGLDDAMASIQGNRTSLKPFFRPLLLRIDHILEPPDWCADGARRYTISGSDHRGVTARIGVCR